MARCCQTASTISFCCSLRLLRWVSAFAIGTIGAFLAFDWPPVLRDALLRLLVAVVMLRMALVVGRLLFAPGAERFRMLPIDTAEAWFWHRRLVLNVT